LRTDANVITSLANAAFDRANAAYNAANTATDPWVRTQANNAYDKANSGATFANGAFVTANAAFTSQNTTADFANGAFVAANSGATFANAAFLTANSAASFANGAFTTANLKFNSSGGTISGDVTVSGNLIVVGTSFYANTETVLIKDNIITLNAAISQSGTPVANAGIEIDRGTSANAYLIWSEADDKWVYSSDGTTYYEIADANRVNNSFDAANSAASFANASFITANASYNSQNTTASFANGAFAHANAAYNAANTATDAWVRTQANNAYNTANSGSIFANGAFTAANTADSKATNSGLFANAAFAQANAAFEAANTAGGGGGTLTGYVDVFTGDGSNSSFTLSTIPSDEKITFVAVQGVIQPKSSYSLSGNVLTFDSTPPNTAYIEITTLAATSIVSSSGSLIYRAYTGNNTATNYTITSGLNANNLIVAENGILQRPITDYTISGANVVFATAPATGVDIQIRELSSSSSSGGSDTFAREQANAAFLSANSAATFANSAFDRANSGYGVANSSGSFANGAFTAANTADTKATSAGSFANSAFDRANAAFATANSANASSGSSMTWYIANANTTMVTSSGYFVDTTNGPKTMTLPTSATLGDTIRINDLAGNFASNNLTVARNSHKIQGLAEDLVVDMDQSSFGLVYSNTTYGWKVLEL
jgi:hypothetical protein